MGVNELSLNDKVEKSTNDSSVDYQFSDIKKYDNNKKQER